MSSRKSKSNSRSSSRGSSSKPRKRPSRRSREKKQNSSIPRKSTPGFFKSPLGPVDFRVSGHVVPAQGLSFHACWRRLHEGAFKCESKFVNPLRDETVRQDSFEDSSFMSDGVDPWTPYNIVLKGFATVSSTSGSTINNYIPCDPSSAGFGFAEWSSLVTLFSEVRILRFTLQFVTYNVTTGANTPVAIGYNPVGTGVPGSEGAVVQLADSRYWACGSDRSKLGLKFSVTFDPRLDFSPTSTVVTTPYAGCPGCVQTFGSGFGVSTPYYKVLVMGLYQFRGRQ